MPIRHFVVVFFICCFIAGASATGYGAAYVLEPGDVLSVNVYGYSELSLEEVVIQPDGIISLPLAGQVQTENLTASEFTTLLTERLERYLENPLVTVNLLRRQPIKVSVLGEVNHPGYYSFERGSTLLDALSMASGWTKDAAKKKISLFHKEQFTAASKQSFKQTREPAPEAAPINLLDMLESGNFQQNYSLKDGDVIYVSSNNRVDWIRDILPFVYPLYLIHHWEKEP